MTSGDIISFRDVEVEIKAVEVEVEIKAVEVVHVTSIKDEKLKKIKIHLPVDPVYKTRDISNSFF